MAPTDAAAGSPTGPARDRIRQAWAWLVGATAFVAVETVAMVVVALGVEPPAPPGVQLLTAAGVAVVGSATVVARARFLRAPWRVDTEANLVAGYLARFAFQLVFAVGVANIGFAGAVITGAWWIAAAGLVFYVAPVLRIAPTSSNLATLQAGLDAQGCRLDLLTALRPAGDR